MPFSLKWHSIQCRYKISCEPAALPTEDFPPGSGEFSIGGSIGGAWNLGRDGGTDGVGKGSVGGVGKVSNVDCISELGDRDG